MFEKYSQKIASNPKFYKRVIKSLLLAGVIITISLLIGVLGYRYFENLSWVDSFLNASMILSGMGPATPLASSGGKIFAGIYALFSGIIFLITIAIILAPLYHRFLHKMHVDEEKE